MSDGGAVAEAGGRVEAGGEEAFYDAGGGNGGDDLSGGGDDAADGLDGADKEEAEGDLTTRLLGGIIGQILIREAYCWVEKASADSEECPHIDHEREGK